LVVKVTVTVLPASTSDGVYVNANGLTSESEGVNVPVPFVVIVTIVALPPNEFPFTVTEVVPHVLPLRLLSKTVGEFGHWQET